jgi:hypothetical protein
VTSDDSFSDHTRSGDHLSDEALSAAVDDGASDEETAHLHGCPDCRARVARLRRVVAAVAEPPPVPPNAVREAAIARAVAAGAGTVVRGPWWQRPRVLAAAAAIVAVLVAVPVLVSTGDGGDDDFEAVSAPLGDSGGRARLAAGGDLGDIGDDAGLRQAVQAALAGPPAAGAGGAGGATGFASDDAATGGEAAAEAAPSETKTAAQRDCTSQASAAAADRVGALRYAATLRWKGTPGQVFVFDAPEGQARPYLVMVMAAADCQLLVFQSF